MAMSQETKARRAAERKREKELAKLTSIANRVVIEDGQAVISFDGVLIKGRPDRFNEVMEKLGYRPIRITSNMLNPVAGQFAIDINTPSYCDPGSEAYHSM